GVDPHPQVKGIVDHVLAQVERHVENVVSSVPAEEDAIGRVSRAVSADGMLGNLFEMLLIERQGAIATDPKSHAGDSTTQEAHGPLSFYSRRLGSDRRPSV